MPATDHDNVEVVEGVAHRSRSDVRRQYRWPGERAPRVQCNSRLRPGFHREARIRNTWHASCIYLFSTRRGTPQAMNWTEQGPVPAHDEDATGAGCRGTSGPHFFPGGVRREMACGRSAGACKTDGTGGIRVVPQVAGGNRVAWSGRRVTRFVNLTTNYGSGCATRHALTSLSIFGRRTDSAHARSLTISTASNPARRRPRLTALTHYRRRWTHPRRRLLHAWLHIGLAEST